MFMENYMVEKWKSLKPDEVDESWMRDFGQMAWVLGCG